MFIEQMFRIVNATHVIVECVSSQAKSYLKKLPCTLQKLKLVQYVGFVPFLSNKSDLSIKKLSKQRNYV
jgi:hypothetical protein